jgi:hypothetical protein
MSWTTHNKYLTFLIYFVILTLKFSKIKYSILTLLVLTLSIRGEVSSILQKS